MSEYDAIFLGILQGLTEFLPVSSSGHLAMAEFWFPREFGAEPSLEVIVIFHLASLLAVVTFFSRDLARILREDRRQVWLVALATVPAGISGLLLRDTVEDTMRMPFCIGLGWLLTGLWLIFAEHRGHSDFEIDTERPGWFSALRVGVAQAMAIFPGVSRAGMTMGSGFLCRWSRAEAVRFSFLLSIPIVLGAAVLEARDFDTRALKIEPIPLVAGFVAAYLTSLLALRLVWAAALERFLFVFGLYCLLLGAGTVLIEFPPGLADFLFESLPESFFEFAGGGP